jgi:signal transduction histidine kinase
MPTALIGELDTLLAAAAQSVQASADELASPLLQRQGLQAAIEDLALSLTRDCPLIARVEGAVPAELEMPDATRAVLFRVLRELALNAARHAKARHLWLRVLTEPERLSIVVGDDGCGFDVARLSAHANGEGGFGLFSADAQMQAIGGRLVVQSKPGRGTRAVVVLPLVPASMADTVSGASDTAPGNLG